MTPWAGGAPGMPAVCSMSTVNFGGTPTWAGRIASNVNEHAVNSQ
jgi:hypothetical protein